jgi:hypothetical protein
MTNLEAKVFPTLSGFKWKECELSKIIGEIVNGENKASEAINKIVEISKASEDLYKNMSDMDQWVHGHDDQGNEAYICENGEDSTLISLVEVPDEFKYLLPDDHKFAKYTVISHNIAGHSQQHGFVWYATKAAELITESVFGYFALTKAVRLYRAIALYRQLQQLDQLGPALEAELQAELEEIPEVDAALEVDVDAAIVLNDIVAAASEFLLIVAIIAIIFVIVNYFVIQDYTLRYLVINLSQKNLKFSPAYLDNVDLDHLPEPLKPDSKQNTLPAFVKMSSYDSKTGFTPDEPYANMAVFQFVNKNTVFEGLGTLLKYENISKTNQGNFENFLSLYEIPRFSENQQNIEINYPRADYKDYYDDTNHKFKQVRIETESVGMRVISQTNVLSGASNNTYDTVVIIIDA